MTEYDDARAGMASLGFVEGYLAELNKKEEQKGQLERAIFGAAQIRDEDRDSVLAEIANDPEYVKERVTQNLADLETRLGEFDYGAVIDSTPKDVLSKSFSLISYQEGDVSNELVRDYHAFLNLAQAMAKAKKEGDGEKLEELEEKIETLAMNRFKSSYAESDDYTKGFIEEFAGRSSHEFKGNKVNQYLKEASEYVSSDDNQDALKDYLKTDIPDDKRIEALKIIATLDG